jgi:hypothetical protein
LDFTKADLKNFTYTFDDTSKKCFKVTLTGDLDGTGVDGYTIYLDYNLDFLDESEELLTADEAVQTFYNYAGFEMDNLFLAFVPTNKVKDYLPFPSQITGYTEAYQRVCELSTELIKKCWELR